MIELPVVEGGFPCIAADPTWTQGVRGSKRTAGKHNPVMTLKELSRLPVKDVASTSAWLFLWCPWVNLPDGLKLMEAWGFEYSSDFVLWAPVKASEASALMFDARDSFFVGRGRTTRKTTIPMLLGRRGSPKRLRSDVQELLTAPWRGFGRKPVEAYERIEAYCEGPRLDIFSREDRDGWYSAGEMTGVFNDRWKGVV